MAIDAGTVGPQMSNITDPSTISYVQDELFPGIFAVFNLLGEMIISDQVSDVKAHPALKQELLSIGNSAHVAQRPIRDSALDFLDEFVVTVLTGRPIESYETEWLSRSVKRAVMAHREDVDRYLNMSRTSIMQGTLVNSVARCVALSREHERRRGFSDPDFRAPPTADIKTQTGLHKELVEHNMKVISAGSEDDPDFDPRTWYSNVSQDEAEPSDEDVAMYDSSDYAPDPVPAAASPHPTFDPPWAGEASKVAPVQLAAPVQGRVPGPRKLGRMESAYVWDEAGNKYFVRPRP